jgi:adenine phosphoribosyltransferase
MDLKTKIREINDFPEKGIIFRDITTLLKDADALRDAISQMEEKTKGLEYDIIIGPESRGFIFGMPIAYNQKKGFVPVRKKGKLPAEVVRKEYSLEYGTAVIEMHADALKKGQKVLIVDDLLATGGTTKAIIELVEEMGAEVSGLIFLIELEELKGREALNGYYAESIIRY